MPAKRTKPNIFTEFFNEANDRTCAKALQAGEGATLEAALFALRGPSPRRKRPTSAQISFTDEDGQKIDLTASPPQPHPGMFYGMGPQSRQQSAGSSWYKWNAADKNELDQNEAGTLSMDELIHYRVGNSAGWGIFEILSMTDNYAG